MLVRRLAMGFVTLVVLVGALIGVSAVGAATTYRVGVGGGLPDGSADLLTYLPSTTRVRVGDTVTWDFAVGAPHTVTFASGQEPPLLFVPYPAEPGTLMLNPPLLGPTERTNYDGTGLAHSGFIVRGPEDPPQLFSLTFTEAGTYTYQCALHPLMVGTVEVVETAPVPSPAEVVAAGQAEASRLLGGVPSLIGSGTSASADGRRTWEIWAGAGSGPVAVNRFLPGNVTVDAGDTVLWRWGHPAEPHTVTFLAGQPAPGDFDVRPQADGPPVIILNPRAAAPSVAPTNGTIQYSGGFLNSGLMPLGPGPAPTFAMTFTEPGSYDYICVIHPGMAGTITVRAASSGPPLVVDSTSWREGNRVSYAYYVRNAGTANVTNLRFQAEVPMGAQFAESWLSIQHQNRGKHEGQQVGWFEPGVTLAPGRVRGPYVVVVDVPEDTPAHELSSMGTVSFQQPTGTAASARVFVNPMLGPPPAE